MKSHEEPNMGKLIQTQINESDLQDILGFHFLAQDAVERTINNESRKKNNIISASLIAERALPRLNCEDALPEDVKIKVFERLRQMASDRVRERWG